jgi:hypothetical protein
MISILYLLLTLLKNKIMKIKNILFYALVIISVNLFSQINNITNINENTINTNTLIQDIIDIESNKDLLSTQEFISSGDGHVFTFDSLSSIAGSGVEKLYQHTYKVDSNFTISAKDTLRLMNYDTIKLSDGIEITIVGFADFNPLDTAVITRADSLSAPKGIYISGDSSSALIQKVRFEYAGIKSSSISGITIKYCTFTLVNTSLSSSAINLVKGNNLIENCSFISNQGPAIASGANIPCSLTFTNNYLFDNNTDNSNRPQINMGPAGDGTIIITNNTIIGAERSKVGGIAVANLLGVSGINNVIISNNYINKCRYGITTNGMMNAVISNNQIIDNKYDPNPMTGGSGISIYDSNNLQNTMITNNRIEDNLWGITIVNGGNVNIGKLCVDSTDIDFNPGQNIFVNNGNNGLLYDLYNNSPNTIYAQGNTWNVTIQDSISIEEVIYHKNDDPTLGEVIYMYHPIINNTTNYNSNDFEYYLIDKNLYFVNEVPEIIKIYNLNGALLYNFENNTNNRISLDKLRSGIYILHLEKDVIVNRKIYIN